MRQLQFIDLPGRFAVCRLPADAAIPDWLDGLGFESVTRTGDELSVVAQASKAPPDVRAEHDFAGFRISGTLDFSQIGVLREVAGILAEAGISVLAVSTFDTDYFFVPGVDIERSRAALGAASHVFLPIQT